MDGGGRLGRSLGRARRLRASFGAGVPRGLGTAAALLFVGGMALAGAAAGGALDAYGAPRDLAARALGSRVSHVTIVGNKELSRDEVLALAAVPPTASLAFLDAPALRARLLAAPLVLEASVTKLHPDRLEIRLTEREPFALWQLDGVVQVVAADGTPIEPLADDRYARLPHVVGPGANRRAREFAALMEAVPEARTRVRAGVLVSERRWTLAMADGVQVKLPEADPAGALRALLALDAQAQVLGKDVIAIDLRVPGRVAFRLTEEAAAARNEALDKRLKALTKART